LHDGPGRRRVELSHDFPEPLVRRIGVIGQGKRSQRDQPYRSSFFETLQEPSGAFAVGEPR
jgi:hypothetical protein